MKTTIKIIFTLSFILLLQTLIAQESEMAKVTMLRKGVKATVDGATKIPKEDDELPLSAKIECDGMGFLDFAYKGTTYRVEKNTSILLSDVIKSAENKNFQPGSKTDPAGTRGVDVSKNPEKGKKTKKKQIKDN